jgi:GH35 family endo-1,4-beta-xylanase
MNRRDFLKVTGLAAACSATGTRSLGARQRTIDVSKEQILDEADARIEKYRKGDAVLRLLDPDGKPLKSGLTLKISQTRHKFLFGCNIFKLGRCRTADDNAGYEKQFAALLNYATLPFYWWDYERQRDKPDDERTEEIARWCKAHDVTTKGHPLAWNWVEPNWLPDDPEAAMQSQFERIQRCARQFKGDIDIWDVVNEATDYDRPQCKERAPKLTEAVRKMGVGSYVRAAFKAARQGSAEATLVINDYRTDAAFAENVLSQLVGENGQPLYDVIGIQSHMHGGCWPVERTWQVCDTFAKFGRALHFTETTIVSGPRTAAGWNSTPEGEKRQGQEVAEFYRVLFSHPAVAAVTWWDFTDQDAWQRAPAGLVRADMTPKPAYKELQRLIKGAWWTQTEAEVAETGQTRFRGFFGRYNVSARIGEHELAGSFNFDRSTKEAIEVQLRQKL